MTSKNPEYSRDNENMDGTKQDVVRYRGFLDLELQRGRWRRVRSETPVPRPEAPEDMLHHRPPNGVLGAIHKIAQQIPPEMPDSSTELL